MKIIKTGHRKHSSHWVRNLLWHLLPGAVTAGILILLFIQKGYAPFGDHTLAISDANVQYMDFFCYLKDVLNGTNNLGYTFGKTLGGTMIAVLSYYMSSPFSLLVLLFDKTQMQVFFDYAVMGKLILAAFTFSVFLHGRFEEYIDSNWKRVLAVLLSVAYSLCQYNIAQNSNIMWMDSVYMLPILLLCVYKVIRGGHSWKLSAAVGIGIVLNWYSAALNCIFALVWILLEAVLRAMDDSSLHLSFSKKAGHFFAGIFRCILSMGLGILLSAFLFLPTIHAMRASNRGVLNYDGLRDFSTIGHISSVLRLYVFGAGSSKGQVALFAGSLAVTGVICCFLSMKVSFWKKIPLAGLAVFCAMMFFWNPLVVTFSLFKNVGSYWYRYSYLAIFGFLFIAAYYFLTVGLKGKSFLPLFCGILFSAALILAQYHKTGTFPRDTLLTAGSAVLLSLLLSVTMSLLKKHHSVTAGTILAVSFLSVMSCVELWYSGLRLFSNQGISVSQYADYVSQMEDQITAVQETDKGTYRISETSVRRIKDDGLMSNFNEPIGFNYWSISGYTSSPDDIQREFLQRAGYRENGENMCIVIDSVLGTDSLLGVKYVLSKFDVNGLKKIENIPAFNGKYTFENPYALPMAFLYTSSLGPETEDETNPFLYQNSLYSELLGRKVELYKPVTYKVVQQGDVQSGKSLVFELQIPEGNYTIYGNIPWERYTHGERYTHAILDVNGYYQQAYSRWTSPSVFHIPAESGDTATIEYTSEESYDIPMDKVQFYALDLDQLKDVTEVLSADVPDKTSIENGKVSVYVKDAERGEKLFLSIPADSGWKITDNGRVAETDLIGKCLYSIQLEKGDNQIEMVYHVPYLRLGIVVSVAAVVCILILQKAEKRLIHR